MTDRLTLFAASIGFVLAFALFASVVSRHAPELAMTLVVGGVR